MQHRGRIQAQGKNLEESESWAQPTPPTVEQGLSMLERLKQKLSPKDLDIRQDAFDKAEQIIQQAGKAGGIDAHATFSFFAKLFPRERVDIEVIKGKAFVK